MEAGKLVDRSVETCVKACRSASGDGELLKQVGAAAGMVSQALGDLLQHVRHYASCGEPIGRYDQATDTIMNVTENIVTSMGDAGELARMKSSSFRSSLSASCSPTIRRVKKSILNEKHLSPDLLFCAPRRFVWPSEKPPPGIFQRSRLFVMV